MKEFKGVARVVLRKRHDLLREVKISAATARFPTFTTAARTQSMTENPFCCPGLLRDLEKRLDDLTQPSRQIAQRLRETASSSGVLAEQLVERISHQMA